VFGHPTPKEHHCQQHTRDTSCPTSLLVRRRSSGHGFLTCASCPLHLTICAKSPANSFILGRREILKCAHSLSVRPLQATIPSQPGARCWSGQPAKPHTVGAICRLSYKFLLTPLPDKYGWQSAIALAVLVVILTVGLRIVDVRYLMYVSNQLFIYKKY
jgi:hypothetical protein